MSKKLYCAKCRKLLVVIEEGRLSKELHCLCDKCDTQRRALELRYRDNSSGNSYMDQFNNIFGGNL